jgi:hypothetical protein
MCFASPPDPPPIPPPPPDPAKAVDEGVLQARSTAKAKARSAQGYSSTILTGGQGLTDAANTTGSGGGKTLLGQ